MEPYLQSAKALMLTYGPKVLSAILLLITGLFLIKKLLHLFKKRMQLKGVEITPQSFLIKCFSVLLKILLLVAVISTLGIDTTAIAAILVAAGLGIALALQGALSNLAGAY